VSPTLGTYLRIAREEAGLTLRQVEARTDISNGYLSLLEHDRVKEPSPRVLWALAECYAADYAELMRRAGYHLPEADARPAVVFPGAERLTEDQRDEIQAIITLKLQRNHHAS
jgi:transcriptional regulator with XRE-family HTH domain